VRKRWKITARICLALLAVAGFTGPALYRLFGPPTEGCPLFSRILPIKAQPLSPSDYIEQDWFPGFSSWYPGHVRLYADGRIERDTTWTRHNGLVVGCPLHENDKHAQIDPHAAQALINHAQQAGFCRLCSAYFPPRNVSVSDVETSVLQLSIANSVKTVGQRAGDPPPLFRELNESMRRVSPMDLLADTSKFTPNRAAECKAFQEDQVAQLEMRARTK